MFFLLPWLQVYRTILHTSWQTSYQIMHTCCLTSCLIFRDANLCWIQKWIVMEMKIIIFGSIKIQCLAPSCLFTYNNERWPRWINNSLNLKLVHDENDKIDVCKILWFWTEIFWNIKHSIYLRFYWLITMYLNKKR